MTYEKEINDILAITRQEATTDLQRLLIMEVLIRVYYEGREAGVLSAYDKIKTLLGIKDE